nr:uncharacterized protein LOC109173561 [Ipomoea batatas]
MRGWGLLSGMRLGRIRQVVLESDEPLILEVRRPDDFTVTISRCDRRVNCMARCLTDIFGGRSVLIQGAGGLPKEFFQLLRLDGIPHFCFIPGKDVVWVYGAEMMMEGCVLMDEE